MDLNGKTGRGWRAKFFAQALVLCLPLAVGACSSFGGGDEEEDLTTVPAETLYDEGLALRAQGNLSAASKKFEELDKAYPYSQQAKKSLINLAYLNYSRGKYPDAITSAKRFLTIYPGSEDAAYALYLIGQSYFKQIPDVTRDQAMSEKAGSAFSELLERFPKSEYADDAKTKLRTINDQLAGKEMQVGRFYLEKRNYIAAINRFKVVVLNYQTTRHVEEALGRLTEAYYALGVVPEAQTAAAVLGHNFPESPWYKSAYSLLSQGGYEPSESTNSWISKAFSSFKVF